ncbi:YveK family protein [Paenibacillus tuaregi]|uniref:YveK family protein n=1 Tax=Paenibacillus tuaregi TaxID=1816681 RepID=UPI0008383B13|nr:Wzz/FepE/Etk N-terminal domain-containing protein [Paenibacillus tuaregi]
MNIAFLVKSVRRHYIAGLLTIVVCVGGAYLINMLVQPQYKAAASLMANIASSNESGTYNEFLASQMLTKTYEDAIQSRVVAGEVKKKLGLKETTVELLNRIKVRTDPGTLVINLYATDRDPKNAVAIVNAFADAFITKSKGIVSSAKVSVLDYGDMEQASVPVSPRKMFNLALGGLIGLFAAMSISLLLEKRRLLRRKSRITPGGMEKTA